MCAAQQRNNSWKEGKEDRRTRNAWGARICIMDHSWHSFDSELDNSQAVSRLINAIALGKWIFPERGVQPSLCHYVD